MRIDKFKSLVKDGAKDLEAHFSNLALILSNLIALFRLRALSCLKTKDSLIIRNLKVTLGSLVALNFTKDP